MLFVNSLLFFCFLLSLYLLCCPVILEFISAVYICFSLKLFCFLLYFLRPTSSSMAQTLSHVKGLKGLKLVHANIRSLLCHFDEAKVDLLDGSFDIVVFSESWLHENVTDNLITTKGYNLFRLDRNVTGNLRGRTKGGGLCIYVKDIYETTRISDHVSCTDLEMLHIVVKSSKQKDIDLFTVYRPPSGNVQNAIDLLQTAVDSSTRKGETILVGDFNLDISKSGDPKTRSLLSFTNSRLLVSHIETPTRITRHSETVIDLLFSDVGHVYESGTINTNISDHHPIYLVKKKMRTVHSVTEILGRSYKNVDWDAFQEEIKQIDLQEFFTLRDPNVVWEALYSRLLGILDRFCPVRNIRLHHRNSEFITPEVADQIHERDRLYRRARKSGLDCDWLAAKTLRSRVRRLIINARRDYIRRQLDLADGDSKKFWRIINKNFLDSNSMEINSVYRKGTKVELFGCDAANKVNDFFCSMSRELSDKLDLPPPDPISHNKALNPFMTGIQSKLMTLSKKSPKLTVLRPLV